MSDYISREDVKKLLWERISLATFMRRGIPNAMKSLSLISEELEKIPAADVRPVRPCDGCPFCVCEKHGVICPSDPDFRCDTRGGDT